MLIRHKIMKNPSRFEFHMCVRVCVCAGMIWQMIFEMVLWIWNGFKEMGDVLSIYEGYGMCSMLICIDIMWFQFHPRVYGLLKISIFWHHKMLQSAGDRGRETDGGRMPIWNSYFNFHSNFSGHKQSRTSLRRIGNLISNSPLSPSCRRRRHPCRPYFFQYHSISSFEKYSDSFNWQWVVGEIRKISAISIYSFDKLYPIYSIHFTLSTLTYRHSI